MLQRCDCSHWVVCQESGRSEPGAAVQYWCIVVTVKIVDFFLHQNYSLLIGSCSQWLSKQQIRLLFHFSKKRIISSPRQRVA